MTLGSENDAKIKELAFCKQIFLSISFFLYLASFFFITLTHTPRNTLSEVGTGLRVRFPIDQKCHFNKYPREKNAIAVTTNLVVGVDRISLS